MKTTTRLPAATLLAIVAFSTSLLAQTEPRSATPATTPASVDTPVATPRAVGKPDNLDRSDRNFIEEAAKVGMKEVEVSNAVKSRLANPQVRAFAETMVADHSAANTELQALAASKGVQLPADKKDYTEKWSKKDGDIDEDYVETMEEDHEEAVKHFKKGAKSEDAEIAAFAQKVLPKLEHHLTEVRALKKIVK
jgi:putative membrane protein